jgi:hypothetical protein
MNRIRRRVSAAVNPVSTAATRWWCHSALRHMLTGYGPTTRQRRYIRHGTPVIRQRTQGGGFALSEMKARARAIDDLLGRDVIAAVGVAVNRICSLACDVSAQLELSIMMIA